MRQGRIGRRALGANWSFMEVSAVAKVPERAVVVRRVKSRKRSTFWIKEAVWVLERTRGQVKKTVAARREEEMLVKDMIHQPAIVTLREH